MKKTIVIVVLVCIVVVTLCLSNFTERKTQTTRPYVLAMVKSVSVPLSANFAGEKLQLDRYDLHERFEREVNGFTYLHSTTMLLIKRANRIFPIIEPILKANGIPDDFKYLATIESSLYTRALSPVKAAGLWQWMPDTAKEYGLEVDDEVDERYSIVRATNATCDYLKQAYAKYGSWVSVALSYNAGQNKITQELDKQDADQGIDLWLTDETSRYFFRILAIKQIFKNPYKYGFVISADQLYKPIAYDSIVVDTTITNLASFAQQQHITYGVLKDFNTWLRDRKLTVSSKHSHYTILIPKKESMYYKKNKPVKVYNPKWVQNY